MAGNTHRHFAAIHALKTRLKMTDEDYRALLQHITGKESLKALNAHQLGDVRTHFEGLGQRAGVWQRRTSDFEKKKAAASPMERKVWALWNQLGRDGKIANPGPHALRAWVKRQTGMDDLAFCNWAQLSRLVEALKDWEDRPK